MSDSCKTSEKDSDTYDLGKTYVGFINLIFYSGVFIPTSRNGGLLLLKGIRS